jgi:hypothetical protein
MTISLKKMCLISAAGLSLGGCGYPQPAPAPEPAFVPAPQVQSRAVITPAVEEEEEPIRNWTYGHVPSGRPTTSDGSSSGPSDSDEDGGWN